MALLNKKVESAQVREDALTLEVKELKEMVMGLKPAVETIYGDKLKETLKIILEENFAGQRVHLDLKINERLAPVEKLFVLAQAMEERKKRIVAGAATGQQGGDINRGTCMPPTQRDIDALRGGPKPSSTGAGGSQSRPNTSKPRGIQFMDSGLDRVRRMLSMWRPSTGLIQAIDPRKPIQEQENLRDEYFDPLLEKFNMIVAKANGINGVHPIGPYESFSVNLQPNEEFDFGLFNMAYLFPLFTHFPDAPKKSQLYEDRLLTWYACVSKPFDEVWSLKCISDCKKVEPMEPFLGMIPNASLTVVREANKEYQFTLADLPNMNFADIVSLVLAFGESENDLVKWVTKYLKFYAYYAYANIAKRDYELGNHLHITVETPDVQFSEVTDKGYRSGEIVSSPNSAEVKIVYEGISEKTAEMHKRWLVLNQIHLYPSYIIENVLPLVKVFPTTLKRLRSETVKRMECVLEFRRRMLLVPALCFENKVHEIRQMKREQHEREMAEKEKEKNKKK